MKFDESNFTMYNIGLFPSAGKVILIAAAEGMMVKTLDLLKILVKEENLNLDEFVDYSIDSKLFVNMAKSIQPNLKQVDLVNPCVIIKLWPVDGRNKSYKSIG